MALNKRTVLLSAAILTFGLGTLYLGLTMTKPATDPNSWDILIFTQTWPSTLCYTWKKINKTHECRFPPDKKRWTIHGIWPTKLGTIGPSFCNKTLAFDPNAIYGIQNELNEYWTDIELPQKNTTNANTAVSNKKSIWFHEWEKHGTCATSLPALDSEFKYFYQGIEWAKEKYSMKDILEKANIKVNSTLNVNEYWKAIRSVLKVNVYVNCVFKNDTKEQLLEEIRICFNKNLELTDCDGIKRTRSGVKTSSPLTNCDSKKPILYLDHVATNNVSVSSNTTASNLTNNAKEWDYLVFSQAWPYTFCHKLKMNSGSQSCNLLENGNQWTIRGIWPTKDGTSGPLYCNNQTMFHLETLDSIKSNLKNQWTEKDEYWGDEWKKHGTCAMEIQALDSEFKYFKQGLDWNKQYPLNDILSQGSIKPNGTYPMMQILLTLKTGLGKKPLMYCFTDKKTNVTYIDELRLCFDKSLTLVDCDQLKSNSDKSHTNCLNEQRIYFPGAQV
ncbi:uncharacterized protein LOC126836224 [Adelges cooleyi]|uniref:uncharacterized protein LOC126836224 n=1 Tax=Adelges cooleyi TaxID=133065 RepID=UPI00217F7476|nr:uncharacterized protein LOC126836224 [Adelges cooleyi]